MLAALAFAVVLQAPDASILRDLSSPQRTVRLAALNKVVKMPKVSPDLGPPLVQFLKIDAAYAFDSKPPKRTNDKGTRAGDFKLGETDLGLVRIKANPRDYVGKFFTVLAGVRVSDYYNYEYGRASSTHYSLAIGELGKGGERGNAFVLRELGRGLVDRIASATEDGFDGLAVRLQCTIRQNRFRTGDEDHVLQLLEITDWQFRSESGEWEDWTIEPLIRALACLLKMPGGASTIAAIVMNENEMGSPNADLLLRSYSIGAIEGSTFSDDDKAAAYKLVRDRSGSDVMKRLANSNAITVYAGQAMKALKPDEPRATKAKAMPKPIDPEAKAAGLLRIGDNLAKAGKTAAAQGYYREVVEKYPSTRAAATARARLGR
jgi:hypothetical protein